MTDKQALRERYSPQPVPKCRICGEEMSIQHITTGAHVTYACSGEGDDGYFKIGRTFADEHYAQSRVTIVDFSDPEVIMLLDELESMTANRDLWYEKSQDLEAVNKASEKRLADLSKAASVSGQWKPDVCPITGREFFMWIEHPTLGYVPTYGGPFDSYTIPTKDSDGEFSCERYDHDFGGWKGSECLGLYLADDDEKCRIAELETKADIYDMLREDCNIKGSLTEFVDSQAKRIAGLAALVVNLPKRSIGEVMHMSGFSREYAEGWCAGNDNARHEIRAAGVKIKEE